MFLTMDSLWTDWIKNAVFVMGAASGVLLALCSLGGICRSLNDARQRNEARQQRTMAEKPLAPGLRRAA